MISQYLGFDSDYIIIGLAALVLILIILMIINVVQMSKLKKSYKIFMKGKNAKSSGREWSMVRQDGGRQKTLHPLSTRYLKTISC